MATIDLKGSKLEMAITHDCIEMLRCGYKPKQILKAWRKSCASDTFFNVGLDIVKDVLMLRIPSGPVWNINHDVLKMLQQIYCVAPCNYPFPISSHHGY